MTSKAALFEDGLYADVKGRGGRLGWKAAGQKNQNWCTVAHLKNVSTAFLNGSDGDYKRKVMIGLTEGVYSYE